MVENVSRGHPYPYGATQTPDGVNFTLYAPFATAPKLHLFDAQGTPLHTYPVKNRTGDIWHLEVKKISPPFLYAWEIEKDLLVVDPFAKEVDTFAKFSPSSFNWGEDTPPHIPLQDLIIYEMHIKGFADTFLGVKEKLPYLQDLGVNALEFLPIFTFDDKENPPLGNSWGYSTLNYFSPMKKYGTPNDLKELIKASHAAGIEVYLDVVFNHTSPLCSFMELDPLLFYLPTDYTGCGNTINCNHPLVREWIVSVLRYWVTEYHVDGFRFDLGSVFYRGGGDNPPLLEAITDDPILADTKLIVEPWDAADLYQVGSFYSQSNRWLEWNGQFRDTVRRFIRGDDGEKGVFATRITGSEDLYYNRTPQNSINFVTCHDGFTLRDLVSYNEKHNWANNENNEDGTDNNFSYNLETESEKRKQMRNFLVALFISQGIPMLFSGDEYGHTKHGNNNTWCQETLNRFEWDKTNDELHTFTQGMIALRKNHPHFRKNHFLRDEDIHWYGTTSDRPQWNLENHFVSYILRQEGDPLGIYVAFNAGDKKVTVTLPESPHAWQWLVNTSNGDLFLNDTGPLLLPRTVVMAPQSSIILRESPKVL